MTTYVGTSMKRKEDPRMITGRGNYTEDINLPGMLHAVVVRSPEAHATISSIDTSAARERDGVVAVLTGEDMAGDFAGPLAMVWAPPGVEIKTPEHWPLKRGQVKHVGDPVAVVVATSRHIAVDAAEDVIVDYDPKPAVVDPEAALQDGSPLVWEKFGTNKTHEWAVGGGDIDAAFAEAEVTVEHRFVNHRTSGAPIETALLDRGVPRRRPHPLVDDPDPAHRAVRALRDARHRRGQAARGGSGRGRRLRRQAAGVRRGGAGARAGQAAGAAGQVGRDPLRAHDHEPPRARPGQLREARRQARRHGHRVPGAHHRRPRRLPAAAHAVHPGARVPGDGRLLPDPGDRPALHGRVHEQDVPRTRSAARAGRRPPTGSS